MIINKNIDSITQPSRSGTFLPPNKDNAWILNCFTIDATNKRKNDNVKVTHNKLKVNINLFEYVLEPYSLSAIKTKVGKK